VSRRSIATSPPGIAQAKLALTRKSLSQKALVTELGISWSTISKFFNGKPVDRFLFIEIAKRLDLNWESLIESPEEPSSLLPPPSVLNPPSSVLSPSVLARLALNPRILTRIPRSIVQNKYLPAIRRGLTDQLQRIVPIIGPAGYGKSTLLGDLYDQLTIAQTPWVGLILCSALTQSELQAAQLDIGLGRILSGTPTPIAEVTAQLQQQGRGVLLIDTLDLILDREVVLAINPIFRQLLEQGVTIVFTCRDHEYNDYLEPTRDRFVGISQTIDRHTVPNFTTTEIRQAAEAFFTALEPDTVNPSNDRGKQFADNILALSADNRSLLEIIQNPLLLALLCDRFARDGNVPPDLTVTKLYRQYWQEKVAYSRPDQSRFSTLAIAKDKFCRTIAQALFLMSQNRIFESIFRDELSIDFTDTITDAYNDLLSEGVLENLPSGKLHFFHQTLMEYAIADWLTRNDASANRDRWLTQLINPDSAQQQSHWYPVLRQYLTLIDDDLEFAEVVARLGTQHIGIFGAIALAAASRDNPEALQKLLPTALNLGEAYQKRLQQALNIAPRHLILDTWGIWLSFLEQANHAVAINTAKMISLLIDRWWETLCGRIPDVIQHIVTRKTNLHNGKDDRSLLLGWFLEQWLQKLSTGSHNDILNALVTQYPLLGHRTLIKILQLHQQPQISIHQKNCLFEKALQYNLPNDQPLLDEMVNFVGAVLLDDSIHDRRWDAIDFLYQDHPKRWQTLQGRAVGLIIHRIPEGVTQLCQGILEQPEQVNHRLPRTYTALLVALQTEAETDIIHFICNLHLNLIHPICCTALLKFLPRIAEELTLQNQDSLAQWLGTQTDKFLLAIVPIFNRLADTCDRAKQLLESAIDRLPTDKCQSYQLRLLRFLPISEHPPLETLPPDTQIALVRKYQTLDSQEATQALLQAARSQRREVALLASQDWSDDRILQLQLIDILPLLASQFLGNQERALTWIAIRNRNHPLTLQNWNSIAQVLKKPDNPAIARLLCELSASWIQTHQQIPLSLVQVIGRALESMVRNQSFDGAPAKPMIQVLKAIAQVEDPATSVEQLFHWVQLVLTHVNLISIPRSEAEMVDLLSALVRCELATLSRLVVGVCPLLVVAQRWRNLSAVLRTVRRVEGVQSPHFDAIMEASWYNRQVEILLLEIRDR